MTIRALIDVRQPINWRHPSNRGLAGWWRNLPHLRGGDVVPDLRRRNVGAWSGSGGHWKGDRRRFGAWSFNGPDDFVVVADDVISSADNWTFLVNVRLSNLNQNGIFVYYHTHQIGFGIGHQNPDESPGNRLRAVIDGVQWMQSGYTFTSTARYYQVVFQRASGTYRWFVDGVQTTNTSTGNPTGSGAGLTFSVEGGRHLSGLIEEVRVYSRALTAVEVARLYRLSLAYYTPLLNWVHTPLAMQTGGPAPHYRRRLLTGGLLTC